MLSNQNDKSRNQQKNNSLKKSLLEQANESALAHKIDNPYTKAIADRISRKLGHRP